MFLEDFRELYGGSINKGKSRLISIKVPERLLALFKAKSNLEGKKYQTQIKILMENWIQNSP